MSWKPLRSLPLVTCTLTSASTTDCGAGDAFGQRDAQTPSNRLGQLRRAQRAVGVAQTPELFRVAEVMRGDVIEPLALRDGVLLQQLEAFRLRHEATPEIDDGEAAHFERRRLDAVVTAGERKV